MKVNNTDLLESANEKLLDTRTVLDTLMNSLVELDQFSAPEAIAKFCVEVNKVRDWQEKN